ncbi:MAG: outer membrane beta-barrel protein [Terriglobia bacterium]
MSKSTLLMTALFAILTPLPIQAGNFYAGALGGLATLSGDGRSILSPSSSQVSLYKPENGPAINLFAGWDIADYVSVQGNYIGNRNDLTLVSTGFGSKGPSAYKEFRGSQQSSFIGDLLVYFRKRDSKVRPYLSGGTGIVHLASSAGILGDVTGSPQLPPQEFSSTDIGLRVAVGMDVRLRKGWAFRYSFSETISHNPISDELSPLGQRGLKNFQNLFGFVKHF